MLGVSFIALGQETEVVAEADINVDTTSLIPPEVPTDIPQDLGNPQETQDAAEIISEPSDSNSDETLEDGPTLTVIDTGSEIIEIQEGTVSEPPTETDISPDVDVLVEVEIIVTELDLPEDPTMADNTDEDPDVDLIDPSIIPEAPAPMPEPGEEVIFVDPTLDPMPIESTESALALLDLLFAKEELTFRRYEKEVLIDPRATHTCRADVFRSDLATSTYAHVRVTLIQNRQNRLPSLLEIGSLPAGIDVVFGENDDYTYVPGNWENTVEFDITRQIGAWEGDFTIPIIYTLEREHPSSVVCQINIFNAE